MNLLNWTWALFMLCKALQDDGNDDGDDDKLGVCIIHDMHASVGKGGNAPYIYIFFV